MSRYSDRLGREEGFDAERKGAAMRAANPVFILRNWVAQVRERERRGQTLQVELVPQMAVARSA